MPKIPLSAPPPLIPEGIHIFRIDAVDYSERFGKLTISLRTEGGGRHTQRFFLKHRDGTPSDGALAALSCFARAALNDPGAAEIDPAALKGRFLEAEVMHVKAEASGEPGQAKTFARLGQKSPAEGFCGGEKGEGDRQSAPPPAGGFPGGKQGQEATPPAPPPAEGFPGGKQGQEATPPAPPPAEGFPGGKKGEGDRQPAPPCTGP